jgi:predicted nucleic acid-binding protein
MRYVIDSSVAFKWVVAEPHADRAIRLREDFRNGIHDLLAPDIYPAEIANALLVAERRGRISAGLYATYLGDILTTPPGLHATIPLLPRVAALTSSLPTSVYDCLYVALAEREACEFVTADDKLVRKLQTQFAFVVHLSSLP